MSNSSGQLVNRVCLCLLVITYTVKKVLRWLDSGFISNDTKHKVAYNLFHVTQAYSFETLCIIFT